MEVSSNGGFLAEGCGDRSSDVFKVEIDKYLKDQRDERYGELMQMGS